MLCENCTYYVRGECILECDGAYDADGEPVTEEQDVCMCEHHMELEE